MYDELSALTKSSRICFYKYNDYHIIIIIIIVISKCVCVLFFLWCFLLLLHWRLTTIIMCRVQYMPATNMPQKGLRERGLAKTMGDATATPRSNWENLTMLLLCAHWGCDHKESKRPQTPVLEWHWNIEDLLGELDRWRRRRHRSSVHEGYWRYTQIYLGLRSGTNGFTVWHCA